ncbi:MAG: RimK family protein [Desulfatitalea sp.]|nr:RimK family protein [Desulfatitalea sp.]NNK00191.1 RimK family protein [Desulfatitalea sp.]
MTILVVIENPEECPLQFAGVEPVAARNYLSDRSYSNLKGAKVFNICRSYRYQSIGYYASLLAEARNHKPVPNITTIQDMKSVGIIHLVSDELQGALEKRFTLQDPPKISIHVYFGKCPDKRFEQIGSRLFKFFPAPFLRADFGCHAARWQLSNVSPLSVKEIPAEERDFAQGVASEYFSGKRLYIPKRFVTRYDMAILHDPNELRPPSDAKALKRFAKAADELDIGVELITREDSNRLSEFDALFIRETTNVDHHTYRMARKALAEGLVVIDAPESILRCSNKVYLAELLGRARISIPETHIVHAKNLEQLLPGIRYPCILKQPDSAFSQGVVRVDNPAAMLEKARHLLKKSELFIAQEFLPTEFDWRIGILDRKPLFACKYYMAGKHWQIVRKDKGGREVYGKVETLPVGKVPPVVVKTALKAANLIGDGLYGVDLKQVGKNTVVIEVNDNPNIEAGYEDDILHDELYLRIMEIFLKRIEARAAGSRNS